MHPIDKYLHKFSKKLNLHDVSSKTWSESRYKCKNIQKSLRNGGLKARRYRARRCKISHNRSFILKKKYCDKGVVKWQIEMKNKRENFSYFSNGLAKTLSKSFWNFKSRLTCYFLQAYLRGNALHDEIERISNGR